MNKKKNRDVAESLEFIIERMATKEDVREIVEEVVEEKLKPANERLEKVDDRVMAVENKVTGIYNLLEEKARKDTDLKIPRRVHDLEESEYGVGKSRHPRHVPL